MKKKIVSCCVVVVLIVSMFIGRQITKADNQYDNPPTSTVTVNDIDTNLTVEDKEPSSVEVGSISMPSESVFETKYSNESVSETKNSNIETIALSEDETIALSEKEGNSKEEINETNKETEKDTTKENQKNTNNSNNNNDTKTELHVHNYASIVTREKSCTSTGEITYTCSDCGYSYKETYGSIGSHSCDVWIDMDNNKHKSTCCVCNEIVTEFHNSDYILDDSGYYCKCRDCGHILWVENYNELINQEFALTNQERSNYGLGQLSYNHAVQEIANRRAKEIVTNFSHDGFNQLSDAEFALIGTGRMGENAAMGHPTAADVHNAWMNSTGHRSNILRPEYTSITIGVYFNPETSFMYWVQIFGDK